MSKIRSFTGFLKTFWQMSREEWQEMDRKLLKLSVSAVSFIAWAIFWLYFLKSSSPFG